MTACLFDWLAIWKPDLDRKTDRQRQTDWLTDQLTACLPACLTNCLTEKWLVFTSCKSQQTADVVLRFDQLRFWNLEVISIELWSLLLVLLQLSILVLAVKDKKKCQSWVTECNKLIDSTKVGSEQKWIYHLQENHFFSSVTNIAANVNLVGKKNL